MCVKDKIKASTDLSINPDDRIHVSPGYQIPKTYKIIILLVASVILIGILYKIFSWGDKNENTYRHVPNMTENKENLVEKKENLTKKKEEMNPNELYSLGSRYEINGDYQKAEEIYEEVNKLVPNNIDYMYSLAIMSFINTNYEKAEDYFSKIIDQGFLSSNVSYWYAKSLSSLGKDNEALKWHYQTLELDDNNLSNVIELLTILQKLKRSSEGLSLIAGYTALYPNDNVVFQLKPFQSMFLKSDTTSEKSSFSVPEINNQYIVPVFFPSLKEQTDYVIDTGAMYMSIPLSLYKSEIGPHKKTGKKLEIIGVGGSAGTGELIILDHLKVGNITLRNVEAIVCENCPPLLGQSALKRFHLNTVNKYGKNFLTISY